MHTSAHWTPPIYPEWLGERSPCEVHGTRFPYVAGAMANGNCTARIVIEMGRAGMLGFVGAAGLEGLVMDQLRRNAQQRGR